MDQGDFKTTAELELICETSWQTPTANIVMPGLPVVQQLRMRLRLWLRRLLSTRFTLTPGLQKQLLAFFAAVASTTVLPLKAQQIDAITQVIHLRTHNARTYGAKGDGSSDDTAALKQAIASVAADGGGYLYLPPGTYVISSSLNVPTGVQVEGSGWGNPPRYGQFGTVIQAGQSFPGASDFPNNMMLHIDGQGDTYGAGVSNLTLDCNNVPGCGGLYRGHANEQTYFRRITVLNFSSYGLYVCGAGENSDAPHVCGGTSNGGAQGDGPDEDLQFLPSTAANVNTLPIVLRNVLSYRGLHNVTVNTSSSAPNQPLYAGWASGIGLNVREMHLEGPANGFLLGPSQGSVCPKNCNGLSQAEFEQVDLTRGGGPAVILAGAYNVTLTNIMPAVHYELNGQDTSSSGSVAWMSVDGHGAVLSNDSNFGSSQAAPTSVAKLTIASTISPQLVLQNTTAPNYPYEGFSIDSTGSMVVAGQGGSGDLLFTNPAAVFGMGSVARYAGLNLQSPFDKGADQMRAAVCSNAHWDTVSQSWDISNNGGSGYSCLFFAGAGAVGISSNNNLPEPTRVSQKEFVTNTSFYVSPTGHLLLGQGAATTTDSGPMLQVNGGMQLTPSSSKPACTAATRGTFWLVSATTSKSADHLQVCAKDPSGVTEWRNIF